MKVDGNKRIVTEKKVAITTNKTEYVRYEVSSSVVTDYRATDGYKDMALRSATGGRVVGGVEWDAGSAPAAFYAPKKKSAFSRGLYAFAKRAFDIVSSLVFLVAFSWLYLILALVVKLCSLGASVITPVNQIIKMLAVFAGCFLCIRGPRPVVRGLISGVITVAVTFFLFAAIAGDYKVIYYCYDSNGNYTVQFYTVSVR